METTKTTTGTPKCKAARVKALGASAAKPQRLLVEVYDESGALERRFEAGWDYSLNYEPQAMRAAWKVLGQPSGQFEMGEWSYFFVLPSEE